MSAFDQPPFPGFRPQGLQFMHDLKQNNERDWFKPRKAIYDDEMVWPLKCLIAELVREAPRRDIPLSADPKTAIFRIYRDVRFSKDKSPYKTHIGAVLSRSGEKKAPGGVYIHIEPGSSFITGGFWRPDGRLLGAWRDRIQAYPDNFLTIVRRAEDNGLEAESEDRLKRMPRGTTLDADHPAAEYLKWKSFLVTRRVSDEELQDPALTDTAVNAMQAMLPLLEYGWNLRPTRSATADQ